MKPHRRASLLGVILLLPALLATLGCSTILPGVHLSPFYRRVTLPDGTVCTRFLGPLGYSNQRPDGTTSTGVRPFYHRSTLPDGSVDEVRSLWPLVRYSTRDGTESRLIVSPLFYRIERTGPEGTEIDWALLPFFFGGREGNGDRYFAFFPLFGTLRGLLTFDEISFLFFPLFTSARRGDFRTQNYLMPLVRFGNGAGRSMMRLFPFYSYDKKDGRYDRRSAFWPFLHWQRNSLHTQDPSSLFFFFPFYGRETSASGANKTLVLWPFFSWAEDDSRKTSEANLPWPFFKSVTSPKLRRFRIWPFYGTYESAAIESKFILWPLYYHRHEVTDKYEKDSTYIVPFYTGIDRDDAGSGVKERYHELWPLIRNRTTDDGEQDLSFLSPIPFRNLGPLEEDYGFLWKLYEHRKVKDAGRQSLYLGLYERDYGPDHESVTIPFLYDHFRAGSKSTTSYLWGLVRHERSGAEKTLSFLWLPPMFRWGGDPDESTESHR